MATDLSRRVASAATRAADYLLQNQAPSGEWTDYDLPPGASDAWVTAYVGTCLRETDRLNRDERRAAALARSKSWLASELRLGRGVGYNRRCPPDSDSTAWTLIFLQKCGYEVADDVYRFLLEFQRPDGGFACYQARLFAPAHSWTASHPDITPVVLRALLPRYGAQNAAVRAGFDYITDVSRVGGLWPSFWWTTPLYSTCMNLTLLRAAGVDYDQGSVAAALSVLPPANDPFSLALRDEIDTMLGVADLLARSRLLRELCERQRADGSWEGSAVIRMTLAECPEPWKSEGFVGIAFPDERRMFTTATVLRCLTRS